MSTTLHNKCLAQLPAKKIWANQKKSRFNIPTDAYTSDIPIL